MTGIVVGVDGSDNSLEALRWAATEARLRQLPLRVVGAFTSPVMATGYEVAAPDLEDLQSASAAMLDAAVSSVSADGSLDGVECVTEVLAGHPGERLIALSAEADMLVVGSRGHGGFMGLMMGSVTTYCVNHAACPVVVVRHRD